MLIKINFPCKDCDYNLKTQERISIIKSLSIINEIKQKLNQNLQYQTHLSDDNFAKKFKVEEIKGTEIVNLIFQHPDPDFADEVMNT